MEAKGEEFWLVWREGSRSVGYKHATRKSADDEAKRLAECNPGHLFYVVKTATAYARPIGPVTKMKLVPLEENINTYRLAPAINTDDEIPF